MRKIFVFALVAVFFTACQSPVNELLQEEGVLKSDVIDDCITLEDGTLMYPEGHYLTGNPLIADFDVYGYNYEAHLFKGYYANAYLGRPGTALPPYQGDSESYLADYPGAAVHWTWESRDIEIAMKWNDAWLSNKDCDGDGALDRHYGFDSYIGSGAWEMYSEKMGGPNGYNYKCKIIAVPVDATLTDGFWYAADGKEIGYEIWGEFAVIEEIMNGKDVKGKVLLYKSEDHSGFGGWNSKLD